MATSQPISAERAGFLNSRPYAVMKLNALSRCSD